MTTVKAVNDGSLASTDDVRTLIELYSTSINRAREASAVGHSKLDEDDKLTSMARSYQAQAKRLIRDGSTSCDLAMDLTILVTDHADRDSDFYRGASWLIEQLRLHPGELLVHQQSVLNRSWVIGRIPASNFPILVLQDASARARRQRKDFWGDGIALTSAPRAHISSSDHSVINRSLALELSHSLSYLHDPEGRQGLFIGDAAVMALFQSLNAEERFHFWVVTRQLGYPIGDGDYEVAAELRRRREAMIPELIRADDVLRSYRTLLAKWQQNPAQFFAESDYAGTVGKVPGGVTINFGLGEGIQEAKTALRRLIAVAKADLLMIDNPTLQQAAATAGS